MDFLTHLSFHITDFLIPRVITCLLAFGAAALKFYRYRSTQRRIDLLMWVAILSRAGLGIVYLIYPTGEISDRTTLIRMFITLLLLVEMLRYFRKEVVKQKSDQAVKVLERELEQIINGKVDGEH